MKNIIGYGDLYSIDNVGNVYSNYEWSISTKQKTKRETPLLLKASPDKTGYLIICLMKNGKKITERIHRLVAKHFIGPRPNNKVVDHIDRNKLNNDVSNLRYVSYSENAKNTGTYKTNKLGEKFINKTTDGKAYEVRASLEENKQTYFGRYKTLEEAIEVRNRVVKEHNLYL